MRYFITFSCYGARLHGEESGSVDCKHNVPGSRLVDSSRERVEVEREQMKAAPYFLDDARRGVVLASIQEVCLHRDWVLWAAHVRTNHVHVVVEAEVAPEAVMNTMKAYASRGLKRLEVDLPAQKRWARHGSTRWLWRDDDVQEAIRYVVYGQGAAMAVYLAGGVA